MNQRYYSLDVFRGATVALMILVNNPGSWEHIFAPLDHAAWHGCTPTDLVFPFFLFAVGNALAFALPQMQQKGQAVFLQKIFKRAVLIFLIGLFLNWGPFVKWQGDHLMFKPWRFLATDDNGQPFENGVRIMGVLQRIAICYLLAALTAFYLKPKAVMITGLLLLLLYWLLCYALGKGDDPYTLTTFFGREIDVSVLTKWHMLHFDEVDGKVFHFEYEGLVSTLPSVVQVLIGYLAGRFIRMRGKTHEMLSKILLAGAALMLAGYAWSLFFPMNKKMWTSSYVLYTSGIALLTLGVFIFLLEFKNAKSAWSSFFNVFGKNPLFIFVLSGFLPRVLGLIRIQDGEEVSNPLSWLYDHLCKPLAADERIGSLVFALLMIAFFWLIVWIMDRKNIYVKV
jgi:predicted acyltransferase